LKLDAGEVGYGGSVTTLSSNSVSKLQFPFDSEIVGTSSTKREIFCADKIFTMRAPSAANSTVQIVLDSAPSIGILLRSGSKIAELNIHAKNIYATALRYNIRVVPTWTPREDNELADEMSKVWANFHTEQIAQIIRTRANLVFGVIPLTCMKVGKLPHFFFRVRDRYKKKRTPLLLLHPVWVAQLWWPHITDQRKKFINVGSFNQVFPKLSIGLRSLSHQPSWRFQISLL
jgi:hypothetical protein